MRALRIDERKDPHTILNDYRRLGDEHRVYHADFSDADLVWTFLVVLEKSADVSPYEAIGEWQDTGGPYRAWEGSGRPCLVCHRMWGLTDPHADTNGLCPWVCAPAYTKGRAPPTAKAPPPQPAPPTDSPQAVGEPQQPATFPFRPHALADSLPDPLDVLTESALDDCPSADDDGPLNPSAFAIAAGGSDDADVCWPALAESPVWIPKIADEHF
ncbi:hypothetical protein CYMTET_40554 [Cymbomonas tetramitiformis]|uniref:Uncharacterized protein n=1 Tax=Cymbomonas tetramitiformis TaxID=36881 RepID=A0AAE0C983_9CHLO|nr:hypothetical protein CYMTET_40554 [Cymbomonas tetramitiformis]